MGAKWGIIMKNEQAIANVCSLVKKYPNDMELGGHVRHFILKFLESQDYDPTKDPDYLKFWTCELCGEHTYNVDYDYLGNGTNHLGCELDREHKAEAYAKSLDLENRKN